MSVLLFQFVSPSPPPMVSTSFFLMSALLFLLYKESLLLKKKKKVEKDAWKWEILLHLPQLPLMETRQLLGLVGVCRASGEGLVSGICLHNP